MATWDRRGDRPLAERLASQPTHSRLLVTLSHDENRQLLDTALADWTERHLFASNRGRGVMRGTIDVDGFSVEVYGHQSGSAYNGYYRKTIYSPLVAAFAADGDYDGTHLGEGFVGARLRKGNASSFEDSLEFIRSVVKRCSRRARCIDVRFDAGFTVGSVLDGLTDDGVRFVGRLRSNPVLQELAQPHLRRPVGRPPHDGYECVIELGMHRAKGWKHRQRIVLCIVDKPDPATGQLDLFPRYFFLVTSWSPDQMSGQDLLDHYRRRGTFEDRIGELVGAIRPRLSSPSFEQNETTLLLSLLASNLVAILRGEMEAATTTGWDLRRVRTTLLKAGARIITKARRVYVDVARSVEPLWRCLGDRIARWRLPKRFPCPDSTRTRRRWIPPPDHAHRTLVLRR